MTQSDYSNCPHIFVGVSRVYCQSCGYEPLPASTAVLPERDRSDFQRRVLDEKRELDIKLGKLGAFLGSEIFQTLTNEERLRLRQQAAVMKTYSEILGQRIEAWP